MPRLVVPACGLDVTYAPAPLEQFFAPSERVEVVKKSTYAFDGRANSTQTVVLAEGIDTASWTSAVLMLRLHARNPWKTGAGTDTTALANVSIQAVYLDPTEPDVVLIDSRSTQTDNISATTTAPLLDVKQHAFSAGAMLRVKLTFSQGALEAASQETLTISVDVIGRKGHGA